MVSPNSGILLEMTERFGRCIFCPNKLGHRFSELYLLSSYISSVEIQCEVMAEMLSVINTRWYKLFLLSLSAELHYMEHFFTVCIIFYKKSENQEKREESSGRPEL